MCRIFVHGHQSAAPFPRRPPQANRKLHTARSQNHDPETTASRQLFGTLQRFSRFRRSDQQRSAWPHIAEHLPRRIHPGSSLSSANRRHAGRPQHRRRTAARPPHRQLSTGQSAARQQTIQGDNTRCRGFRRPVDERLRIREPFGQRIPQPAHSRRSHRRKNNPNKNRKSRSPPSRAAVSSLSARKPGKVHGNEEGGHRSRLRCPPSSVRSPLSGNRF